jgi:hypothetical protein
MTPAIKFVASLLRMPLLWLLALPLLIAAAHAQTPEGCGGGHRPPGDGQRDDSTLLPARHRRHAPAEVAGNDAPVKVFVLRDDSPEHATFSKTILQVFPHQLRMAWDRQVFSGQGQYPEQVGSTQEMLSRVASTPGAIGYVKASEVNQNVRVLKIR